MSEPIWCNVAFHLPPTWTSNREADEPTEPWFISAASKALYNGECADFNPETSVWSVNGEGNYGLAAPELSVVLDWCREQRVPFVASDDTKYDMIGSLVVFDGVLEYGLEYTEGPILTQHTYRDIVAGNSPFESADQYFEIGNLTVDTFSIDHLPVDCPAQP